MNEIYRKLIKISSQTMKETNKRLRHRPTTNDLERWLVAAAFSTTSSNILEEGPLLENHSFAGRNVQIELILSSFWGVLSKFGPILKPL